MDDISFKVSYLNIFNENGYLLKQALVNFANQFSNTINY